MSSRKDYVDYIKAIAIILVIVGHINYANSHFFIKQWIYAIHMPIFFFSTGLVLKKKQITQTFIANKFKRLIIPYFLWGLIYSSFSLKNVAYLLWGSYQSISWADSLTSLWFLVAMFIGAIAATFCLYFNNYISIIAMVILYIVSIILPDIKFGYPWCLNAGLMASAYILLGYFFAEITRKKFMDTDNMILSLILMCLTFCTTLLFRFNMASDGWYVMMAKVQIGNPLIFTVVSVAGCLFVYSIARIINGLFGKIAWLSYIGKNTLIIFLIQKPIISLFEKVFLMINIQWYVQLVLVSIGVLVISYIISKLINKFTPFLVGEYT